ncbi:MAG: hypothetical protein ACREPR_14965 [Brasilonema sp.]
MEELVKILMEQNALLRELVILQKKPLHLGFSDRPPGQPQWIFVGRNGDSCLYRLDGENRQIVIQDKVLTGYITDLEVETVVRRNKETQKLNVTVATDLETYVLSGGRETCFAKSLLASLMQLDVSTFRQPISLSFAPGEDDSIVWCRVYCPAYIKALPFEQVDFDACVKVIVEKIGQHKVSPSGPQSPQRGEPQRQIPSEGNPPAVLAPQGAAHREEPVSRPANVVPFASPPYPHYNQLIKKLRAISGHQPSWIIAQCRVYGSEQPGQLDLDSLRKLVEDMAIDYGVSSELYRDRATSLKCYKEFISALTNKGETWSNSCFLWFKEIRTRSSSLLSKRFDN